MLKELFELVKGTAENNIVNNPDVPNEQNDALIAEATNTVASGLRNVVAGGGVQNLLSLFGNNQGDGKGLLSNPIVNMMVGHFAGKLMTKYNLGSDQANHVAGNLIPDILGNLINKTNDSGNNTFSLENLLRSITGNKNEAAAQTTEGPGLNIQDILNRLGGSQSNGDSTGGLMDIVTKLARGAQSQQQKNGGGGLMDIISGYLK